jgi:hypothetical protein
MSKTRCQVNISEQRRRVTETGSWAEADSGLEDGSILESSGFPETVVGESDADVVNEYESERTAHSGSSLSASSEFSALSDIPATSNANDFERWLMQGKSRLKRLIGKVKVAVPGKRLTRGRYKLKGENQSKRTERYHRQQQQARDARLDAEGQKRLSTFFQRTQPSNPSLTLPRSSLMSTEMSMTNKPDDIEYAPGRNPSQSRVGTPESDTRATSEVELGFSDDDESDINSDTGNLSLGDGADGARGWLGMGLEQCIHGFHTQVDSGRGETADNLIDPELEDIMGFGPDRDLFAYVSNLREQASGTETLSQRMRKPLSGMETKICLERIEKILNPRNSTNTRNVDQKLDRLYRGRLQSMAMFLRLYQAQEYTDWDHASQTAAIAVGRGQWLARRLREWTMDLIADESSLPVNQYGRWNSSTLDDEDLMQELNLHLQSVGKWICAQDVVRFMNQEHIKDKLQLKQTIHLRTAQRWMNRLDYRWQKEPKGQYSDGHGRWDVVDYRQTVFLPAIESLRDRFRIWRIPEINRATMQYKDNDIHELPSSDISLPHVVLWCHDESTFYANDRRKLRWVHKTETAKPYAKGEGASLMVADFVSADYGWLRSPDR